jgi:hypothetical protein
MEDPRTELGSSQPHTHFGRALTTRISNISRSRVQTEVVSSSSDAHIEVRGAHCFVALFCGAAKHHPERALNIRIAVLIERKGLVFGHRDGIAGTRERHTCANCNAHLTALWVYLDDQAANNTAAKKRFEQEAAQVTSVRVQLLQVLVLQEHSWTEFGSLKLRHALYGGDCIVGFVHHETPW